MERDRVERRRAYVLVVITLPALLVLAGARALHRRQHGDLLRRHDAGGPYVEWNVTHASPNCSRRLLRAAVIILHFLLGASHIISHHSFTALGAIPILGNRGRVANSAKLTELSQTF